MSIRYASAAALLVVSAPVLLAAGRGYGPELGNNKVSAEIQNLIPERPDVDDYVAELIPGERFQAKIGAARRSDVRLAVSILDPDGDDRTGELRIQSKKGGKKVVVKPFTADEPGPWTVRIEGVGGTEGAYTARFKVQGPPKVKLKKQVLDGGTPQRTHTFPAHDRTRVDVSVKWGRKDTPVEVRDLSGPAGQVSGLFGEDDEAFVEKATSLRLRDHLLDAGSGDYGLTLGVPGGAATYKLQIKQAPPPRANGKVTITSVNDPHIAARTTPLRSAAGQPARISGRNFAVSPLPTVLFGPFEAEVVAVGGARDSIDVVVPPGADGAIQDVVVVNPDGQSARHPDYILYVAEAVIDEVEVVSGPLLGAHRVLREGGNVLEVRGRNFAATDTHAIGGVPVTATDHTPTSYRVTVPAHAAGPVDLTLTDEFGRVQTVPAVVHHVGFDDVTGVDTPAGDAVDDLSAWDGLLGDLAFDGRPDDLVLITYDTASRPYPGYYYDGLNWHEVLDNPVGTRSTYTRILFGDAFGTFTDRTDTHLPAVAGARNWNARGVALGDLDDDVDGDLVLAGAEEVSEELGVVPMLRALSNGGSGSFTFEAGWTFPILAADTLYVINENYPPDEEAEDPPVASHNFAGPRTTPPSYATVALGDLDGDDDLEVVAGFAGHGTRTWYYDPAPVDFTQDPPYVLSSQVTPMYEVRYYSGTRVFENDVAGGTPFTDVTEAWLPSAGIGGGPARPAFPARHLALGDVDGDLDLDLVVTFNNPAAVLPVSAATSYGYYRPYSYGKYYYRLDAAAQPAVATRVLTNDGSGTFTDATATWMPAGSGDEYWQGHRVVLHDLDGDDDLDLVLAHRRGLNEWRGQSPSYARPSLRVLENTGTGFVDVTATALPPTGGAAANALRGRAVTVGDIDQDGHPDLVVGTDEAQSDGGGVVPSTRILWGGPGLTFALHDEFGVATAVDTGEVHAVLLGDLDRDGDPALILLTEAAPGASPGSEHLRAFDWIR